MTQTRSAVLQALAELEGDYVSGEHLSASLGITRASVSKAVQRLRDEGYEIESATHRGHRLVSRPDRLTALELHDGLATSELGWNHHHVETAGSTQDIARALAADGAPHGATVVAEEQQAGRGRLGRAYVCPRGGIWATVLLRGPVRTAQASVTGLAAGVAVARAIAGETDLEPSLKWPNDVQVGRRKVCGILTELAAEELAVHYLLVGIGINAAFDRKALPVDLHDAATTLATAGGAPVSRKRILQSTLLHLEGYFEALRAGDSAPVIEDWRAFPNMIGERVRVQRWDDELDGVAIDLDVDGALIVEAPEGQRHRVLAGDVLAPPETGAAA